MSKGFDRKFNRSKIPERFKKARLTQHQNFTFNQGKSYFLSGSAGTGKTHLLSAIGIWYLQHTIKSVSFITVPELLLDIKDTFHMDLVERDIFDHYTNVNVLLLDDLGAEKSSDWVIQCLYIIIDRRYRNMDQEQATIITSNLSLSELSDRLHRRLASRIRGMCLGFKMNGPDRRLYE